MAKRRRKKNPWKTAQIAALLLLPGYIIVLAAAFFALRWHWTDVQGGIDPHTNQFQGLAQESRALASGQGRLPVAEDRSVVETERQERMIACNVQILAPIAPANTRAIVLARASGASVETLMKMLFAVRLRLSNHPDILQQFDNCDAQPPDVAIFPSLDQLASNTIPNLFPWANTEEWGVVQQAFAKDGADVARAASASGADGRLIVSVGFVEQMRLYHTQRELYEKFFLPLKILGNATKQAWGIMAIKEATAIEIENHLKDPTSEYYLGLADANLLDFSTQKPSDERFARLTNEKNHYYSYLYAALELEELSTQWQRAGFPINDRPEILATLFNLGYAHSKPNDNPQVGGSSLTIDGVDYTFGSLAFEFYYSGLLMDSFPYPV